MLKDDIAPCNEEQFLQDIKKIINDGRNAAYGAVNSVMIRTNWAIGKRIVEQEQAGADRAEYGKHVIQVLSEALTAEYGKGFNKRNLAYCRLFYRMFTEDQILQTRLQNLTWSHYVELLRVDNEVARNWYLQEAALQQWSVRTQPVEAEMKALTAPFQKDKLEFIKNPIVAEFLGLSPNLDFTETKLEAAIITQIQKFLLELGKGYAFVDRRITHQDVGQMDMYVRMYDELKCGPDDNPTIGLILCADTSKDIAKYSILRDNKQLFAAKYLTYLPSEEELRREIERQKEIFQLQHSEVK